MVKILCVSPHGLARKAGIENGDELISTMDVREMLRILMA